METRLVEPEVGWKPRGRPRHRVPAEVVEMLQETYRTGKVRVIDLDADTDEGEVREFLTNLRCGARDLGKHVRIQREDSELRFFLADAPLPRKKAS